MNEVLLENHLGIGYWGEERYWDCIWVEWVLIRTCVSSNLPMNRFCLSKQVLECAHFPQGLESSTFALEQTLSILWSPTQE